MNDIRSILSIAARRLETGSFLLCAHVATIVVAGVVVVLLIAERVGPKAFWPWACGFIGSPSRTCT